MIMPLHIDNIKQATVKRKVGDKKDVNFISCGHIYHCWANFHGLNSVISVVIQAIVRDMFATGIKLVTQMHRVYQSKVLHPSLQF